MKKWMGWKLGVLLLALAAGAVFGCANNDDEGDVLSFYSWPRGAFHLVTACSDYITGAAALTRMNEPEGFPTEDNAAVLDADPGPVRMFKINGRWLAYAVGRQSDAVFVFDPLAGMALRSTLTVGPGFWTENPYDVLVIDEDKAYVTRQGSDDILIIDPEDGTPLGNITFTGIPTNVDGLARPADMVAARGRVFVVLQNLDAFYNFGAATVESGIIAVINPATDAVETAIMLDRANPGRLLHQPSSDWLIVACAGLYWDTTGQPLKDRSGIEVMLPYAPHAHAVVVSGDDPSIDGNIFDVAMAGPSTAFILVTEGFNNVDRAQKLDLITGLVDDDWRYPAFPTGNDDLSGVAVTPDGFLAIGDRVGSGVEIWDLAADAPAGFVDLALPPMSLGVVP